MFRSFFPRIFGFTALLVVGACASSSRIGLIPPVSEDLPPELAAKFGVEERPGPVSSPTRVPKAKPKVISFVYPSRRSKVDPVWVGERQVLEITYLGLKAGEFVLQTLPFKQVANRKVYHLRATAISSNVMNLFYRVNDSLESFWDYGGLFSFRFHMLLDQTKQKRDSLELYDSEAKKVTYWNRRNHVEHGISESKETFDMPPFPQDSFTALYYVRNLPLEVGKVFSFPISSEGKSWEAVITVVRKEMLETPLGPKMCIVISPKTRYQGVLQQKTDSFIWLTDDDRRFIVRLEAQLKFGSIAAQAKQIDLGEKPHG